MANKTKEKLDRYEESSVRQTRVAAKGLLYETLIIANKRSQVDSEASGARTGSGNGVWRSNERAEYPV